MLNSKLPKKKPISDQLRKNDYLIDLRDYKYYDSNDYVNLIVNTRYIDTVAFRQNKIILISNGLGYSLSFT